jgi:hypothetical protein
MARSDRARDSYPEVVANTTSAAAASMLLIKWVFFPTRAQISNQASVVSPVWEAAGFRTALFFAFFVVVFFVVFAFRVVFFRAG